jgi:tetratricopeptide (TPR) repeat protein
LYHLQIFWKNKELQVKIFTVIALVLISGIVWAEDMPPHEYIQLAESHYRQGDYQRAIHYLLAVPGVNRISPVITAMLRDDRAKLYYDLGCSYLASGDSLQADFAFQEAFSLNDRLSRGYFEQSDPGTYWWALLRNQEAARRLKTKRLFATMRSLVLPGWGQFYRGHTKKGYAFLGATIVTSAITGLKYRSFRNARSQYEQVDRRFFTIPSYGNEDGTRYTEWELRHRIVKNRAKNVNMMLGILGAIWLLNMSDSAVFGPAPMGLTVQF